MATNRVPLLLVRTSDQQAAAFRVGSDSDPDWRRVATQAGAALVPTLKRFGASDESGPGQLHGRLFTLNPAQRGEWDLLTHKGPGAYVYGMGWDENNRIARNFQFRELGQPITSGAPPVDPLALATAVAMVQTQASIQQLHEQLAEVGRDVKAILSYLLLNQQAGVLAAADTIARIHGRYEAGDTVGATDWARLAPLEQVLTQAHRTILGELHSLSTAFTYRDVHGARRVAGDAGQRAADLLELECWLLEAIKQWVLIAIAVKEQRNEWSLAAVQELRDLAEGTQAQAEQAASALLNDTEPRTVRGRDWWEMLFVDGLVVGYQRDTFRINRAESQRLIASDAATNRPMLEAAPTRILELVAD